MTLLYDFYIRHLRDTSFAHVARRLWYLDWRSSHLPRPFLLTKWSPRRLLALLQPPTIATAPRGPVRSLALAPVVASKESPALHKSMAAPTNALPEWEMVPDAEETWSDRAAWSHDSIAQTQRRKWEAFLQSVDGPRPLGQPHEGSLDAPPDYGTHNTIMTFGYVLGRASLGHKRISVLDWGGGLGHYCIYAHRLFPELAIDYVIKDLPQLCRLGAELVPQAKFVVDEAEALARRYDLVFASSSLHYARDPYDLLDRLCASADKWLMITRTPIIERHDDFIVVQRPHFYGYMTEYPGWFMNRKRLVDFANARKFSLERQFLVAERPFVANAPEQADYFGFLFHRVDTVPADL